MKKFVILQKGPSTTEWYIFEGTIEQALERCRKGDTYNNYGFNRAILLEYNPWFEIGIESVEKFHRHFEP